MSHIDETTEDITCEVVFAEWKEEHLEILADEKDLRTDFSRKYLKNEGISRQEALVLEVCKHTRDVGVKILINSMNKKMLEGLVEPLDEEYLLKNNNSLTKSTMAKRLYEKMTEFDNALIDYIGHHKLSADIYIMLLTFLGETPKSEKRKHLYLQLFETFEVYYLNVILSGIPAHFLKSVCAEINIHTGNCNSPSLLAECIIYGKHYVPERFHHNLGPVPTLLKKPKRISDECQKGDLNYWFTAKELKAYCESHELKSSGKKTELADRIFTSFNAENVPPSSSSKNSKKPLSTSAGKNKAPAKSQGRKKKTSRALEEITNTPEPMTESMDISDSWSSGDF